MKVIRLHKQGSVDQADLQFEDIPIPEPKENEIRIKVQACSVCHTDLHIIEGDLPLKKNPIIPGHEIIGVIDKIGKNITHHKPGDRVGVAWLNNACLKCKFCKQGLENLCPNAQFTGYDKDGGYAEYVIVPETFAYIIPDLFSSVEAAPLMCAGVIGYRSLKLSNIKRGQTLGLFGFGASAHIVIQIAKYWGCDVFVFTRSKNHQQHALELGANWSGSTDDQPPHKIDAGITFAPSGQLIIDALKILEKGGTLAINAIHLSDIPPIKWNYLWYEKQIRSIANVTRQDAVEFLELAGKIPIKTTVTTYSFNDVRKALKDMKESKINGAPVLKLTY